jgi:pyruvate/2-oxoglutarate dehydrogenase complex dihydrolipoamide acyltransferase (E2) component
MGPEHPDGIDIGLDVPGSLAIRAAAGGKVISAGGSDEDALGLSIVIDHGQGLTTTYGHLSEIVVAEGERVVTGGLIGVGGSTGTSTGVHLHFEVRKDGATVDPLDILPEVPVDTLLAAVDCASSPIVVPAGSNVRVDYGALLGAEQTIAAVRALAFADGPPLEVAVEGRTAARILSPLDFDGPDGEDEYSLAATVDAGNEIRVLSCVLVLQRRDIPTTFYVRAEPTAEEINQEPTPVPPTPTPNPWPQGPIYSVPASEGSNVVAPDYGLPGGSGIAVQSPSYHPPAQGPTPAVPQ